MNFFLLSLSCLFELFYSFFVMIDLLKSGMCSSKLSRFHLKRKDEISVKKFVAVESAFEKNRIDSFGINFGGTSLCKKRKGGETFEFAVIIHGINLLEYH